MPMQTEYPTNKQTDNNQYWDRIPDENLTKEGSKRSYRRQLVGIILLIAIIGFGLFVVYRALPQNQQLASNAAAGADDVWFTFVPATITPAQGSVASPKIVVRKKPGYKVSAVRIEFTYDATKISNLTATINDWINGKQPVILEPFHVQTNGGAGVASITLGAPCDQNKCYPLTKLQNKLLTLNFQANGSSEIRFSPDTSQAVVIGSDTNNFSQSKSGKLEIVVGN